MAQANRRDRSTPMEAETFCRVQFHYQIATHGTVTLHEADCGVHTLISALKDDLKGLLGPVAQQNWSHRGAPLHDNKTLFEEGIHGRDRRPTRIFVKQDERI